MLKKTIAGLIMASACLVHAAGSKKVEEPVVVGEMKESRAIMDGVYSSFSKIIPVMYLDNNRGSDFLKNKKSKAELLSNLNDIQDYFSDASHVEFFQKPGFRPSLEVIHYHLKDTINAVESSNFQFAQKKMKGLTGICISCHTQLQSTIGPVDFTKHVKKESKKDFDSNYSYANYLYLMRDYSQAANAYEEVVKEASKKGNNKELLSSLRRIFSISTKVEFNYAETKKMIEKYTTILSGNEEAQDLLKLWDKSLERWKDFDPKKVKSVKVFVDKYLVKADTQALAVDGKNDITYLISSGYLASQLASGNLGDDSAMALYYMAIAEKALSETYFYSLGDIYLKDCVMQYSKTKYAKLCYEEYKNGVEFGYTGSSGTDIPEFEQKELKRLKALID